MSVPRHIIAGLVLFFTVSAGLIAVMRGGINSPDEAANKLFAHTWRTRAELFQKISESHPTAYPLFPRSTAPVDNGVVPSGFVGLSVIYGSIATLFGEWIIFYLTMLTTALAALAWRHICGRVFGRRIGDISFWLFLFQPAVIYYSVRGSFPNMAALNFVIIAVAAAWQWWESRSRVFACLAILSVGAAIVIRPPEALVLFGLCACAAGVWGGQSVRRAAGIGVGSIVAIGLLLFAARAYKIIPGAYSFVNGNFLFPNFLFPFGIHLVETFRNASKFIVWLFAPWVVFSIVGVMWWLYDVVRTKKLVHAIAAYLTVVVPASIWLFILYGSWRISDNPADPYAVTLGVSYVRYWLPHLVFLTPFAALLYVAVADFFQWNERRAARIFVGVAVVAGLWRAIAGVDGLWDVQREVRTARATVQNVLNVVPRNAVLAVRAWDKHFFPARTVLQPFPRDIRAVGAARELLDGHTPVWAFIETLRETDVRWLAYHRLSAIAHGTFGYHTLYELSVSQ